MRLHELSEEVLVAEGSPVQLGGDDIEELKRRALSTPRRRIRICAHPDTDDALHEMFIVHAAGAYVRPHRHSGKSESMHVIEGLASAVFFDDAGEVTRVVLLGPSHSARRFYYRLDAPVYHTLLIESDFFVMHEVTNGPFRRELTEFAPWAPDEADAAGVEKFVARIAEQAGREAH